jgi:two-component system nitrate/nitrite response regulator NarL
VVRILLHSDMPVVAAGLNSVLAGAGEFELAEVHGTMTELRGAARALAPQVLLLDLTAEFPPGILAELDPSLIERNVVLWIYEISPDLALQAMSLGVRGILRSTLAPELLLRCLERVARGELWYEKALVDDPMETRRAALTPREIQLIRLLAMGLKNKEIASTLDITEGTVKVYLSRLFQKLGVKDRFELALYGLKHPAAGSFRPGRPPLARRGRSSRGKPPVG